MYRAARGELLVKLGRDAEAAAALGRALECPVNRAERDYLTNKLRREARRARRTPLSAAGIGAQPVEVSGPWSR